MTECLMCGSLLVTTGCPKCNTSVKAPVAMPLPTPDASLPVPETQCCACPTVFRGSVCPRCGVRAGAPPPPARLHWEPGVRITPETLLAHLKEIQQDLEPLRNGSYSDGIKQLATRLKDENTQLRKENAELAAQLKSAKAALKMWEEGVKP